MTIFISYIAAFILSALVNIVALVLLVPFKPLISRARWAAPAAYFLCAFVGGFGTVWAYITLAEHTFLEVAYFMLMFPALLQLWNDMRRVKWAKKGLSGTKRILEHMGEPESYEQAADVRSEQSEEFGRVAGYVVGLALFVGNAPFFA